MSHDSSPLNDSERVRRIRAAMWGLLIGDAIGVPFESRWSRHIPPAERIGPELPEGYLRAHRHAPVGAWSDDGAQALCLAESLVSRGGLDLDDLLDRIYRWWSDGYLAVDGRVFDIGGTTFRVMERVDEGHGPGSSGLAGENNNGNGALMRLLPLAIWHRGTDEALARDAMLQSSITHAHVRSQLCCAIWAVFARGVLVGRADGWEAAVACVRSLVADRPAWKLELEEQIIPDSPPWGEGRGYVVDSMHSARWALQADDYATVVRRAIRLGHDTDSTAAIAGGIAAMRTGLDGIPSDWFEHLAGKELAEPIIEALALSVSSGQGR